jgi:cytochrome c oxidase assembly protein subunit 15
VTQRKVAPKPRKSTTPAAVTGPPALRDPRLLYLLTLVSLVANVLIVVTGGGVRVTKSGLGCPTWPTCTDASLIPTTETAGHGLIEFSNRMVSIVLAVVVLGTLAVALLQKQERKLAGLIVAGYFAQAVLGGITVLTDLNPWVVGCHFLLSAAMIAAAFALWWRVGGQIGRGLPSRLSAASLPQLLTSAGLRSLQVITAALTVVSAAVLVFGTIVTGSGPHAGDFQKGRVRRNGLSPELMSQLHADAVMVLIGLSVGAVFVAYAVGAGKQLLRATQVLVAVELAQGAIGFIQYFTHLPALLVLVHMFGACLVWLATLVVVTCAWRTGTDG